MSIFPDVQARKVDRQSLSLRELADRIADTTGSGKAALPLLKLARFGDSKTPKLSLRHDANMESVDGVEGDYDGGEVSLEEAAAALEAAGVAALLYATPSWTADRPRWRAVCPTSDSLRPTERRRLVARLDVALGGILSGESYTPSQAFYFGTPKGVELPEPILVAGGAIDLVANLDAGELADPEPDFDIADLPRAIDHDRIQAALAVLPDEIRDGRESWLEVGMALHHESNGGEEGFEIWSEWSAESDKFDPEDQRRVWDSFKRDGRVTIGTLYHLARQYEAGPEGIRLLTPDQCALAPRRGYVVKGLLAPGDFGCIFGEPGAGKSLLAPLIGYRVAQGARVFGLRTRAAPVFYVAAEDPAGMRGRVAALRESEGEAPNFFLVEGISDLFSDSGDVRALRRLVEDRKPALIFIDTLALAFPGIEENAGGPEGMGRVIEVARSLGSTGAAVVLIHHGTKADGSTPRGHSSFNGALDMSLMLKRDPETGLCQGTLRKNRNGPCDTRFAFEIGIADHGRDDDGDAITTAFALESTAAPKTGKALTPSERAALAILAELDTGSGATEEAWRARCVYGRAVSAADTAESRAKAFRRAFAALTRASRIDVRDGRVFTVADSAAAVFEDASDLFDV